MGEMGIRLTQQVEIRDCCAFISQTWLHLNILNQALHSMCRSCSMPTDCKTRGGEFCVYISEDACSNVVRVDWQCFPDVKFLIIKSHAYYPQSFAAAVYVPQGLWFTFHCATLCKMTNKWLLFVKKRKWEQQSVEYDMTLILSLSSRQQYKR